MSEQGASSIGWAEQNRELFKEGWRLHLSQLGEDEWKAFYGNAVELPRSAKGRTPDEAVENVHKLIRGDS